MVFIWTKTSVKKTHFLGVVNNKIKKTVIIANLRLQIKKNIVIFMKKIKKLIIVNKLGKIKMHQRKNEP